MTRKDHGVVGERGDLAEAVVHLLTVAPRKIGPSATVEEEGVSAHEGSMDVEALAPRGVSGGVQKLNRERADVDFIAVGVSDHLVLRKTSRLRDPRQLVLMGMDRNVHALQELGEAVDRVTHHRSSYVVRVIVADQDTGDRHLIALSSLDDFVDVICGVDDEALLGVEISDQIHIVGHRLGQGIRRCEIASGQQLAEVGAYFGHLNTLLSCLQRQDRASLCAMQLSVRG